ncbi:MAG: VWA domain-containing protein, partial [Prevotella sp.]
MFRFANPTYLWLLLLIPLLAIVYHVWALKRRKRMDRFGDKELLRQLVPGYSKYRPLLKFYVMEVALALIVVIVARPQMGTKLSKDKREGIEAMIAMDISNSMLAEDVAPSRLERSKRLVEDLLNRFTNDKIGLVVFAGDAFVQLPITSDYVSAKMFLDNISPS